jgi:hypothetical protein
VLAGLVGIAAAVPALSVAWGLRPRRFLAPSWSSSSMEPALWCWILALPAVYVVRDVQVVSRYLEIVLPILLVFGAAVAGAGARSRRWVGAWVFQIVFGLVLTITWVSPGTRAFSRTIDAALGDIASWLHENTEPHETVAIYDIGLVGYRADRPILDLGGLIDAGINDLRNRYDDETILRDGLFLQVQVPQYLVHRDTHADTLLQAPLAGYRAEPILSRTVANLGLSRPEPVVYTLYRLHPPGS